MKKLITIAQVLILCLFANQAFSQAQADSANLRRVETIDGNDY